MKFQLTIKENGLEETLCRHIRRNEERALDRLRKKNLPEEQMMAKASVILARTRKNCNEFIKGLSEWFDGEYITIEIDTETMECKLVKVNDVSNDFYSGSGDCD